jgi:IgA peptidase M64
MDCIMFSRDDVPFCAVCRRAIERIMDFYTGREAGGGRRQGRSLR